MKKIFAYLILVAAALTFLSSCGAKKKGCGLTAGVQDTPGVQVVMVEQVK